MYRRSGLTLLTILSLLALPTEAALAPAQTKSWTLTAVGDIMLDRYVRTKIQRQGAQYPFAKVSAQLKDSMVVLANLEGPFTSSTNHAIADGTLSFTFEPKLAPALKQAGITTLSLGNNHTLNRGTTGLASTRTTLQAAELEHFGDPKNRTNFHLTKTFGTEHVTFLGYDELDGAIEPVLTDIRNAKKKNEYIIVVPHWGNEYQLGVQPRVQREAKQLIDAGADMILGGHPHVVEPLEIYKGKLIAYSLGNFVFDQTWSAATQEELLLNLAFTPTTIEVSLVPLISIAVQPQVSTGNTKTKLLERLANSSVVSQNIRDGIRRGSFTLPRS